MSVTHEKTMLKAFDRIDMQATTERAVALARTTLQIESDAIVALRERLATDDSVGRAVAMLLQCKGRVVVSGIGKSGHIARKIAATLASTGTPAMFVHPAEAAHGDLGMVTSEDAFIAISYSGESTELMAIMPVVKRMGGVLISMTGKPNSSLAQLADVHLDISVEKEACPLNLAPTASTTVTLALGDAIAVALLDLRGFKEDDFARSHPGGALGRRLLTHVHDVMRSGERVPKVAVDASLLQALEEMTKKGMGMTAIVDADNRPVGVFTDGDLRRMFERVQDFTQVAIRDVMHAQPRSIAPERLAVDAVAVMEQFRINQMLVVDADAKLVGALHIHDLTQAKVI
ncbi:KpsF/GutQ family sugar-phosphate isomerase [Janthinobacterium sp. CAN_S1]|uniref:KpsF/GutQ family sugar-phosphate isomerase n=1 Tax=Janthinobacterium sp. CAN_S1 TaxID=2787725 RepID=UPI003FA5E070